MTETYRHRQTSQWLRMAAVGPGVILFAVLFLRPLHGPALVAALGALVIVSVAGWMFSTLTIAVDAQSLRWWFGPGLMSREIARAAIASVEHVRNPWWYGFGVHRTPRGWLYNVGGLDAVEIALRDGGALRLGTDEPEALLGALTRGRA